MNIPVRLEPALGAPVPVEYRWDPDTDILTAHLEVPPGANGSSGSVDVEGNDGSWLIFDVAGGRIRSVEVAVWPPVRKRSELAPPGDVPDVSVTLASSQENDRISALEVNTLLAAESDRTEATIHFRLGPGRSTRTVRIARDILLDIDGRDRLAGVWLLGVPPFPEDQ
jgi:hypothetical protein